MHTSDKALHNTQHEKTLGKGSHLCWFLFNNNTEDFFVIRTFLQNWILNFKMPITAFFSANPTSRLFPHCYFLKLEMRTNLQFWVKHVSDFETWSWTHCGHIDGFVRVESFALPHTTWGSPFLTGRSNLQ